MPEDFEEQARQQITFDARQGRTKLLLFWLGNLSIAQGEHNYNTWLNCLKSLYYICFAFVKEAEAKEVKALIVRCENKLKMYNNKRNISDSIIMSSLDEATEKLMLVFKDQFMQTTSEESGEFDPTKFDGD